jgi:uncharacterized protein (DUF362 family)
MAVLNVLSSSTNLPNKETRVLLKPNIVMPNNYPIGTLTNPLVVEEVAKQLIKLGARAENITIGESALTIKTTQEGLENMGYYEIAEKLGLNVLNILKTKPKTYDIPNALSLHKVRCSQWVVEEIDFIVSIPVLKVHLMAGVTLGTKNLMGTIPTLKSWLHAKIETNIVDLANFLKPKLTVIDGSTGSEFAEIYGRPVKMDCVIASTDVFAADKLGAMVMGINPDFVEYFKYVPKKSLDIEIVGDDWKKIRKEFELPFTLRRRQGVKNVRQIATR